MCIIMTSDIILNGKDTRANHLLELFNELSKISKVYLVVPTNQKKKDDCNIKYIFKLRKFGLMGRIHYELNCLFHLFFFCTRVKANAIYHRQSGLNVAPLIVSKLLRIPFFVEVNGLLVEQAKMKSDTYNISKLDLEFAILSEKLSYKFSKKIIVVADGIKNGLVKLYNIPPEKLVVVQNGADTDLFRPLNKKEVYACLGFSDIYKYIGFVGSFAPWHGLEHLINSAPLILAEYQNVKFVLIGDGGLKGKIKKTIEDKLLTNNFIVLDRIPHPEVPKYINLFDICIIFKHKNIPGSPLKLAEYMACGKPIIATNSDDFEILKEINAGFLVDPEKADEVCSAAINLLKDATLREKMGINAREYVVINRSWENAAREVFKEISSAI